MRRTALWATALLTSTAIAAAVIAPSIAQGNATPAAGAAPAQSGGHTGLGVDLAGRDTAVKPGDDFDSFANGGWRAHAEIPADRLSTGTWLAVGQRAEAANDAIVTGSLRANAAPGTDLRRIADWYTAFTDTRGIEARGLTPLRQELAAISALRNKQQLSQMLGANIRVDVDPLNATDTQTENLFGLFVTQAFDKPDTTVPYVLQGGLGMPDRDYYLSDKPEMAELRTKYRAYLEQIFTLAHLSEPAARAQRVFDLEMKIAAAHTDSVTAQDSNAANNTWTRADFARNAPGIDWAAFWTAAQLGQQGDFIVWEPATTTKLAQLVANEPLAAWQDWLTFHRINEVSSVLPAAFDQANFDFFGRTLYGQQQQRPRDKRAIASVNTALGDAVGQIYVREHFPASSRTDIENMVTNIRAAFDRRVAALTWMADSTKAEARRKIETMHVGVGYPDTWRNYSTLEVRADDPVGNLRRAQIAETRHQLAKIGKAPDRNEWWMTPQTVNAVNLPLQNALNFPAAILQPPFYNPASDPAANYGAIGAVIGHEISHSFDNLGSTFDASGRLRNWWTPEDLAHFNEQGAALVAQYNAYEALPGLHLNGQLELGENIADVAGLTAAYDAYHASLNGREAPVIGGLTGDQRFFLAYAQAWRDKMREQALRARVVGDVHAPARWRVFTVRNLDAWYNAYNVQAGEKLYLAPEQRVRVW